MKIQTCSASALLLLGIHCSPTPNEPDTRALRTTPTETVRNSGLFISPGSSVPGFVSSLHDSAFQVGPNAVSVSEFGFSKTRGDWGTFAIFSATGAAHGIPNADSPTRVVAPLTSNGDEHNAAVVSYFVGRGLPVSQILRANAHAAMHVSGRTIDGNSAAPQFDWYSSAISRQVDGILVAESFAIARINADNVTVSESVYWPALDLAVVDAARSLSAAGPPQVIAAKSGATRVVIHHTSDVFTGAFAAVATWDVIDTGIPVRHFDQTGTPVVLPEEEP